VKEPFEWTERVLFVVTIVDIDVFVATKTSPFTAKRVDASDVRLKLGDVSAVNDNRWREHKDVAYEKTHDHRRGEHAESSEWDEI